VAYQFGGRDLRIEKGNNLNLTLFIVLLKGTLKGKERISLRAKRFKIN